MKVNDIKAGYLLVMKDGDRTYNVTVIPNKRGVLGCCCADEKHWFPLGVLDDNLVRNDLTGHHYVMQVWGEAMNYALLSNTTESRTMLWSRAEKQKKISEEEYHKILLSFFDLICRESEKMEE